MGMEVAGSDLPKVNGEVKSKLHDQEVGKIDSSEGITFGSQGVEEQEPKGEKDNVSNANNSKDNAADEWPEMQCHYFWFVKLRPLEDQSLKAKIDNTEKEIQKYQQQISKLYEEMKAKTSERTQLQVEKNALYVDIDQYQAFINEKKEEMKPLQNALGTLRGGGGGGANGFGVCSTEEELNQLIRSYEYQIQHESLSLKEEKQLLREIKELEATRPKVIANSAQRSKIQESMRQKEAILDQVKLLGSDVDGVRKQKAAIHAKTDRLKPQLATLRTQIEALKSDLDIAKERKKAGLETMNKLREQRDKGNAYYYNEYRPMFAKAKEIAVQKDVKALEELCSVEVEKFMSQWNSSKAFRDDYEKRILKSLDYRQMSRDGRIRNFDEKPLVTESPRPESDVVSKAAASKPQKEVVKTTSKVESLPAEKAQKETKKGNKELKPASERAVEEEDVFVVEKPKKDVQKVDERDAAKLREMKKEEEKEKQRQALERKKKMQGKAAAKAAARAQKEAEKKQKEREKKLRKKEASTSQPNEEEPAEKSETDEAEKPDNVEEVVETPAPSKAKVQQNSLRHRKPIKTRGAPPKAILKKKKSDKYLLWGSAAAAALGVLLLLVLGYKYYL